MSTFKERILRAAKLDIQIYEEVVSDSRALGQAFSVVILSCMAAGLVNIRRGGINGVFSGFIIALIGWYVWALLTYFIGTRCFPEPETKSNLLKLLRTIGFSSSPGLIRVLGIIPGFSMLSFWGSALWMLVAMVIGVRIALNYKSTFRAVLVCFIGWIIQLVVVILILPLFR